MKVILSEEEQRLLLGLDSVVALGLPLITVLSMAHAITYVAATTDTFLAVSRTLCPTTVIIGLVLCGTTIHRFMASIEIIQRHKHGQKDNQS